MNTPHRITADDVDALAAGALLLGSGGGGAVALGRQLLHRLLGRPSAVRLVPAAELPPEALVVHAGVVGSPDVLGERLLNPADLAAAASAVAGYVGGELSALGVIEIGGLNGPVGVLAAAELGLPLVDGDLMGRAFPRIDQSTLALAGCPITPLALVNPAGDTVLVPRCAASMVQPLVSATVGAMGGAAVLALFPSPAGVLAEHGVAGSVSACLELGRNFLAAIASGVEPELLVDRIGGRVLADGQVDEVRPRQGGALGAMTVTDRSGSTVRIDHLDEFLAVTVDGAVAAATPEVIVAMDASGRAVVRTDQVHTGQRLVVFTLPALHRWRANEIDRVGPSGFGLHLEVSAS